MQGIPAQIVGEPLRYETDGAGDDLLTAGLGIAGLRVAVPEFADPERPTPPELRRRAIHHAYGALIDVSDAGGCGRLYGPSAGQRVAGVEYLALVRTPDGAATTTVMLQLPRDFNLAAPCLLAVASAGSRGIYGALPNAADWALKRGYAVVHTDKGTGTGVWDLDRGNGYRIDGTRTSDRDDPRLGFAPRACPELEAYARREPHTLLFKHAHSGVNPEADWGSYLLQAIAVAFELLNQELRPRPRLAPANTLVIAAGLSNGGATVLRALERDRAGWISGAVAAEPNAIVSGKTAGLAIEHAGSRLADAGIALYDYTSLHYLLQPCAALAETDPAAPFAERTRAERPALEDWCRTLQSAGVLPAGEAAKAARGAREQLREAGMLDAGLRLGHFNLAASLWPALIASYSWAYSRRPPWDPPCGVSFAATDAGGRPRPLTAAEAARLWADSSGIAPTAGVSLVMVGADGERRAANDGSAAHALRYAPERVLARAPGALEALPPDRLPLLAAIRAGQDRVVMSARTGNRPVIVFHGRADSLIPVNHSSRAYYAVNQRDRGERDELRYYELEHGQHFDAFLGDPAFAASCVPMQAWLLRMLDRLHARLTGGVVLPPSQVIRSRPRGGGGGAAVPPLTVAHLGELRNDPGADAIRFADGVLTVPR